MVKVNQAIESNQIEQQMHEIGAKAKLAAGLLANVDAAKKNQILHEIANAIRADVKQILEANADDMKEAAAKNLDKAMLDRLQLNENRVEAMAKAILEIAELKDPVGEVFASWQRPNGLKISRMRVPLGVIGIIYESRPNVTADASALCIKSGNAIILRGGSESFHSSNAIVNAIHKGLKIAGLPEYIVQMVPTKERAAVGVMLAMNQFIDIIIPRGGKGLCKRVMDESKVPTLLHLDGNCHSYVHEKADIAKSIKVIENAKLRRPGVCGATESLVVDKKIASNLLPKIADVLIAGGCEIRGDKEAMAIDKRIKPASDVDFYTEYLDLIISVKIVNDLDEAIRFINIHSSHHTEAILTEDTAAAMQFEQQIDSAIVMHNTSTQFADGGEFGMGAEIGIATGRLHARGPVGVEQLTTYKYIVEGDGQIRPVA